MLADIDLIFGIWVYNDELQIKFTFHSGPMIFGRVMALGLWNLAKYLVVSPVYFTMIWDIDLIFGLWVYWWVTDQVWISFRLNDFGLIYALWTFNFGQIFSCHHALRYWFLVFEITMTSLLNIDGGDIDTSIFVFFFFAAFRIFVKVETFFVHIGEKIEYTVYLFHKLWHCISIYVKILYIPSAVYLSSLAAAAKSARVGRAGPYTTCLGLRPPRPLPRSPLSLSPPLDLLTVLPLGLLTDRSPRPRLPFPIPLTTGMSWASEMGGDSEEGDLLLEFSEIWWKRQLILKQIFK